MSQRYQSYLTTPQQVGKSLLSASFFDSVPTEGQAQYDDFFAFCDIKIPEVSEWFMNEVGLSFIPYLDTKAMLLSDVFSLDHLTRTRQGARLRLPEFALEIESVNWVANALTVNTEYIATPTSSYPYSSLDLAYSVITYTDNLGDSVDVSAFWGYHVSSNQLYTTTSDSVTLTDSATTITVANADNYERYQYLRIEDELLLITARNTTTEVLTVERGVNGTTAAAHTSVAIKRVNLVYDVRNLATYLVSYMYQNRNAIQDVVQISDIGVIIPKMPAIYDRTIKRYRGIQGYSMTKAI